MSGPSILVIDDNPTNLRLASFILEKEGYDVLTAASASQGLEALAASKAVRLVLMDLQLPGVDGFELTRALRANPEHAGLRIIAVTAFAMKGDRERALAAGCDDYLSKPVAPAELRTQVAKHLALVSGGHL